MKHLLRPFLVMGMGVWLSYSMAGCGGSGSPSDPPDPPDPPAETWYVCGGTPAQCLKVSAGWSLLGEVIPEPNFWHASAVYLPDGRTRIYGEYEPNPLGPWNPTLQSYISNESGGFDLEDGTRGEGRIPDVVRLSDGRYRMYFEASGSGVPVFRSAISSDGLNFVTEPDDRLVSAQSGNEATAFSSPRVVELADGSYRMYYTGGTGLLTQVLLSAVSPDGLIWTREDGIRVDGGSFCKDWTHLDQVGPIIDSTGTVRIYAGLLKCDSSGWNDRFGIFEFTSADGLTFAWNSTPIVEGYYLQSSFHDGANNPHLFPSDPFAVLAPDGLHLYFWLAEMPMTASPIAEQGQYCLVNPSIH